MWYCRSLKRNFPSVFRVIQHVCCIWEICYVFQPIWNSLLTDFFPYCFFGKRKGRGSIDISYKYLETNHRATLFLGKERTWCECQEHLFFTSHHLLQIESHQGGNTVIIHTTMKPHHQQEVSDAEKCYKPAINIYRPVVVLTASHTLGGFQATRGSKMQLLLFHLHTDK